MCVSDFQVSCIKPLHFSSLTLFPSVRTTLLDRFLCHGRAPPEDAGLHSNKVHHPKRNRNFPTHCIQEVTGQALLALASVIRSCTGDVYHDFGSLSVIKWASSVGNCDAHLFRGETGVPCPFPGNHGSVSHPVDIGSF